MCGLGHNCPTGRSQNTCFVIQNKKNADMRVFRLVVTAFLLGFAILCAPGALLAQLSENIEDMEALNGKADELYRAGEAVGFAEQALDLAEQRLGQDDARVGIMLRNVALLYTVRSWQARLVFAG